MWKVVVIVKIQYIQVTQHTSDNGLVDLPQKTYDAVNCSSSGNGLVFFGDSYVKNLMIMTSGNSKVYGFTATGVANISANGNSINTTNVNQNLSGKGQIVIRPN